MTTHVFNCGDVVIGKAGNPGDYSYTSDKAVCKVLRTEGRDIRVKIVAILDGHGYRQDCSLSEWNVNPRNFEFYDLEKHGDNVIKGEIPSQCLLPKIPGVYRTLRDSKQVTVIDPSLKSFGKVFTVKERFETGFVNIGDKRPIIIRKEKLAKVDKPAVTGDYIIGAAGFCSLTFKAGNIYKVEDSCNGGACLRVKHVYGPDPIERVLLVSTKNTLRLNTANPVVEGLIGKEFIEEFLTWVTAQVVPRKFWMIASHIEGGIYPPEHPEGLYAPRRKIYSKSVAESVLADMIERHGKRFYLLEAVSTGCAEEEPHPI